MTCDIRVLTTELDAGDGLIVTFSDGTTSGYVAEELLELRPYRELTAPLVRALDIPCPL
jgi:hypothetical protein